MQRFLLAVSLLMVVPALPAVAAQQDDMISKKLVSLLFHGFLDAVEEGMPADFPADVLPDGARPLVSMHSSRTTTVVVEAPAFTLADTPRYERKLAAGGWKDAPGPMGARGLTSRFSAPAMLCRDDRMLSYSTQARQGGGHYVRISLSPAAQSGVCGDDRRHAGRSHSIVDDTGLPSMPPPSGSRELGSSSGGSGEGLTQTMALETDLSHADVEAYYTALMSDAGWTEVTRLTGEGLSIARFAAPSPAGMRAPTDGVPRFALIEALALPPGGVLVTLRVIQVETARRR